MTDKFPVESSSSEQLSYKPLKEYSDEELGALDDWMFGMKLPTQIGEGMILAFNAIQELIYHYGWSRSYPVGKTCYFNKDKGTISLRRPK